MKKQSKTAGQVFRTIVLICFLSLTAIISLSASPDSTRTVSRGDSLDVISAVRRNSEYSRQWSDTPAIVNPSSAAHDRFDLSTAFNLDDLLHVEPGLFNFDTEGSGYPPRLSAYGLGFTATGLYLDGFEVADPLDGQAETRAVAPGVLAAMNTGAVGISSTGRPYGINLRTFSPLGAEVPLSEMKISFGSYGLTHIGGSLSRRIFNSNGLTVSLDKYDVGTELGGRKAEQIRFYGKLERVVGKVGLLSLSGIHYGNRIQAPGNSSQRFKRKFTQLNLGWSSSLGENLDYFAGYSHTAAGTPYMDGSTAHHLEPSADRYILALNLKAGDKLRLGVRGTGGVNSVTSGPDSLSCEYSVTNHFISGTLGWKADSLTSLGLMAGVRSGDLTDKAKPVFSLSASRQIIADITLEGSYRQDWLLHSLQDYVYSETVADKSLLLFNAAQPAELKESSLGVDYRRTGGFSLAGAFSHLEISDQVYRSPDNNLQEYSYLAVDNFSYDKISYGIDCPLFKRFQLSFRGEEILNMPDNALFLPERRHAVSVFTSRDFFSGDMTFSLRAEGYYEGAYRYSDWQGGIFSQPGRVNFGGALAMRILDATISLRADYLLSNYYNGVDPVPLPGQRAVFNLNWKFKD